MEIKKQNNILFMLVLFIYMLHPEK